MPVIIILDETIFLPHWKTTLLILKKYVKL